MNIDLSSTSLGSESADSGVSTDSGGDLTARVMERVNALATPTPPPVANNAVTGEASADDAQSAVPGETEPGAKPDATTPPHSESEGFRNLKEHKKHLEEDLKPSGSNMLLSRKRVVLKRFKWA